jgi:hypothetical protein
MRLNFSTMSSDGLGLSSGWVSNNPKTTLQPLFSAPATHLKRQRQIWYKGTDVVLPVESARPFSSKMESLILRCRVCQVRVCILELPRAELAESTWRHRLALFCLSRVCAAILAKFELVAIMIIREVILKFVPNFLYILVVHLG